LFERFRVYAGERELYRDFDGEWRRWDRDSMTWVGP
jgi:alkaline phosphatase D